MGDEVELPTIKDVRRGGARGARGRGSRGGRGRETWARLPSGVCYYFANGQACKFGETCNFSHIVPEAKAKARGAGHARTRFHSGAYRGKAAPARPKQSGTEKTGETEPADAQGASGLNPMAAPFVPQTAGSVKPEAVPKVEEKVEDDAPVPKAKPRRRQPKKRAGGGYFVRQRDPEDEPEEGKEKEPAPYAPFNKRGVNAPSRRGLRLKRSVVTDATLKELKDRELQYLQRRYTKAEELSNLKDGQVGFRFNFCPTDPDWAFDIRSVRMRLILPPEYPLNPPLWGLEEPEEAGLPTLLARHIEDGGRRWLAEKKSEQEAAGIVESHLRPFLLWLDRSLERLFIDGLKAVRMDIQARESGITLVVHDDKEVVDRKLETLAETTRQLSMETPDSDASESDNSESESESEDADEEGGGAFNLRPGEIEIRVKAEWSETVASLSLRKLSLVLACVRCHARYEPPTLTLKAGGEAAFAGVCENCGLALRGKARPLLAHQHSQQLGALSLEGCTALDVVLLSSELLLTCLECNGELPISGLGYGELRRSWCNACNRKLQLRLDALRFHTPAPLDQAALLAAAKPGAPAKEKRTPKDPRIREGCPLPENGACKHYKKSYRWFRFPCCGKVFACDVCHEESESHEMKLANRIICGFCAKEQPYQGTKGCIGCGGAVVALRTAHWEGGKGCRNTSTMSQNDKQKYAGQAKTVSNHKKALLKAKKKKAKVAK